MDRLMSAFYWPTVTWVEYPSLTLMPVLVFGVGAWHLRRKGRRRRWLLVAAVCWAIYSAYEGVMYIWAQQVIAPIRIDLILLGPVMYAVTLIGLVSWWRARNSAPLQPQI